MQTHSLSSKIEEDKPSTGSLPFPFPNQTRRKRRSANQANLRPIDALIADLPPKLVDDSEMRRKRAIASFGGLPREALMRHDRAGSILVVALYMAPLVAAFAPGHYLAPRLRFLGVHPDFSSAAVERMSCSVCRVQMQFDGTFEGRCDDADALRKKYSADKAMREKSLLAAELLMGEKERGGEDRIQEYIARWGGADLAQEGPTRKVLELMSDSEW